MKKDRDKCRVCGRSLDNPLAKSRGKHADCTEKDGSETMEK